MFGWDMLPAFYNYTLTRFETKLCDFFPPSVREQESIAHKARHTQFQSITALQLYPLGRHILIQLTCASATTHFPPGSLMPFHSCYLKLLNLQIEDKIIFQARKAVRFTMSLQIASEIFHFDGQSPVYGLQNLLKVILVFFRGSRSTSTLKTINPR